MSPRVAIICLVLVAAIFVAAITMGFTQDATARPPRWFKNLTARFASDERIASTDLRVRRGCSSGAAATFLIMVGQTCELDVAANRDVRVRRVQPTLVEGRELTLALEPRGDVGVPVKFTLRADMKVPTLQAFEDGAAMTLTCTGPAPATLRCAVALR